MEYFKNKPLYVSSHNIASEARIELIYQMATELMEYEKQQKKPKKRRKGGRRGTSRLSRHSTKPKMADKKKIEFLKKMIEQKEQEHREQSRRSERNPIINLGRTTSVLGSMADLKISEKFGSEKLIQAKRGHQNPLKKATGSRQSSQNHSKSQRSVMDLLHSAGKLISKKGSIKKIEVKKGAIKGREDKFMSPLGNLGQLKHSKGSKNKFTTAIGFNQKKVKISDSRHSLSRGESVEQVKGTRNLGFANFYLKNGKNDKKSKSKNRGKNAKKGVSKSTKKAQRPRKGIEDKILIDEEARTKIKFKKKFLENFKNLSQKVIKDLRKIKKDNRREREEARNRRMGRSSSIYSSKKRGVFSVSRVDTLPVLGSQAMGITQEGLGTTQEFKIELRKRPEIESDYQSMTSDMHNTDGLERDGMLDDANRSLEGAILDGNGSKNGGNGVLGRNPKDHNWGYFSSSTHQNTTQPNHRSQPRLPKKPWIAAMDQKGPESGRSNSFKKWGSQRRLSNRHNKKQVESVDDEEGKLSKIDECSPVVDNPKNFGKPIKLNFQAKRLKRITNGSSGPRREYYAQGRAKDGRNVGFGGVGRGEFGERKYGSEMGSKSPPRLKGSRNDSRTPANHMDRLRERFSEPKEVLSKMRKSRISRPQKPTLPSINGEGSPLIPFNLQRMTNGDQKMPKSRKTKKFQIHNSRALRTGPTPSNKRNPVVIQRIKTEQSPTAFPRLASRSKSPNSSKINTSAQSKSSVEIVKQEGRMKVQNLIRNCDKVSKTLNRSKDLNFAKIKRKIGFSKKVFNFENLDKGISKRSLQKVLKDDIEEFVKKGRIRNKGWVKVAKRRPSRMMTKEKMDSLAIQEVKKKKSILEEDSIM